MFRNDIPDMTLDINSIVKKRFKTYKIITKKDRKGNYTSIIQRINRKGNISKFKNIYSNYGYMSYSNREAIRNHNKLYNFVKYKKDIRETNTID